ncbi:MAG: restriction endonuclease subunit S, partial [Fibrobacter sp.]|nr:restriction endonuclease subunit S [Fibrobacter sp.]
IETLKTNAETNLKNAKELFETTLEKELNPLSRHSERSEESSADLPSGWEWKKMRDVCEVTSSKRIFKDEYVKRGIPFYRTKEIKELSHGEPLSLELFISEEKYNQIKQKFGVPQIGDVLISAVGTIGEILVISNNNPFYFKDGNIIWLKNISLFDSIFLKYELKSIIDSLKAMTRGAAYNALTIEKLKECKIPLPPLSVQKEIVARLDKLSENVKRLEANYKQIIANCDELKKSILKQTFQGGN